MAIKQSSSPVFDGGVRVGDQVEFEKLEQNSIASRRNATLPYGPRGDLLVKVKVSRGAWLRNGNPVGDPSSAPRCGARTRRGTACQCPAIRGRRRCRLHGGLSTGPRTLKGWGSSAKTLKTLNRRRAGGRMRRGTRRSESLERTQQAPPRGRLVETFVFVVARVALKQAKPSPNLHGIRRDVQAMRDLVPGQHPAGSKTRIPGAEDAESRSTGQRLFASLQRTHVESRLPHPYRTR
jgi:hypothetical protein